MTDAYRTSAFTCPSCRDAPLREFQDRLVCDQCGGMLITVDDITESTRELDAATEALAITDGKPSTTPCPRCTKPMVTCKLQVGSLKVSGHIIRCASDGIWFPLADMTAMFALVSRRASLRGLGGRTTGGGASGGGSQAGNIIGNMPSGHSGMSGAMASIANAFGGGAPASSGLAISHWEAKRPRVHTLFVSAHKDRKLGCPACKENPLVYLGDRWACATCSGSFVETPALAAMISEMSQQPWEPPAVSGAPGQRACPICNTPMLVEVLEAVTIDRCGSHGVWFDDTELQDALHHVSGEPSGMGGWLKHLFHRHGTTE